MKLRVFIFLLKYTLKLTVGHFKFDKLLEVISKYYLKKLNEMSLNLMFYKLCKYQIFMYFLYIVVKKTRMRVEFLEYLKNYCVN